MTHQTDITSLLNPLLMTAGMIIVVTGMFLVYVYHQRKIKLFYEENYRIMQEIHNECGSNYSLLGLKLYQLKEGNLTREEEDKLKQEAYVLCYSTNNILRRISHKENWKGFLPERIQEHLNILPIRSELTLNGTEETKGIEIIVYRIFKELVNNILKHASPTEIKVTINYGERLILEITDNGKVSELPYKKGFGLKSIDKQLKVIKGKIDYKQNYVRVEI